MEKTVILIVEDDSILSCFLSEVLGSLGYAAIEAASGTEALQLIMQKQPDVILLDLGLPDMDGLSVIRSVKGETDIPIIVVSARDHGTDKVAALDAGADDYVTKPFDTQELLARIRAAMRHRSPQKFDGENGEYRFGTLRIDLGKKSVTVDGKEVHLTQNEYKITALLCKNAGKTLTHKDIIEAVWGRYDAADNRILRVNIANIRRKLGDNNGDPCICTETGVGYKMQALRRLR